MHCTGNRSVGFGLFAMGLEKKRLLALALGLWGPCSSGQLPAHAARRGDTGWVACKDHLSV